MFRRFAAASPSFKPTPSYSRMKYRHRRRGDKNPPRRWHRHSSQRKNSTHPRRRKQNYAGDANRQSTANHRGNTSAHRCRRTPNTDDLNLPAAGIATDNRGFLRVDSRLETNVPGIYGIGDVKGGPAFTHISYATFASCATTFSRESTTHGRTHASLHRVHRSAARPHRHHRKRSAPQGIKIRVAKMPMTSVARAARSAKHAA